MGYATDSELQTNRREVDSFRKNHAGYIFEVFTRKGTFVSKSYTILCARVWNPTQKIFEVLDICNDRASSWEGNPSPFPELLPDASDALRKEVDAFLNGGPNLPLEQNDTPHICKGCLVWIKSGPNAGYFGKVFWLSGNRMGLTKSCEKHSDGTYKDVVWADRSEVDFLLPSVPRVGSAGFKRLFQFAPYIYSWTKICGATFQDLWGKASDHPTLIPLMIAYVEGIPSRYGSLMDLMEKVSGDRILAKSLREIGEKAHSSYFSLPDFSATIQGMIDITFPQEDVTNP